MGPLSEEFNSAWVELCKTRVVKTHRPLEVQRHFLVGIAPDPPGNLFKEVKLNHIIEFFNATDTSVDFIGPQIIGDIVACPAMKNTYIPLNMSFDKALIFTIVDHKRIEIAEHETASSKMKKTTVIFKNLTEQYIDVQKYTYKDEYLIDMFELGKKDLKLVLRYRDNETLKFNLTNNDIGHVAIYVFSDER